MIRKKTMLPCSNSIDIVNQIEPTIHVLQNLDVDNPKVLQNAGVDPVTYHKGLVFNSAIETIRGQQAARKTKPREDFVGEMLRACVIRG
jgi:hypothetical protein